MRLGRGEIRRSSPRPKRRRAALAMAVFAPFLLAAGPAPKKAEPAPQKATAQKEDFVWFPAFMLKKQQSGFSVEDVSLGLAEKGLRMLLMVWRENGRCYAPGELTVKCFDKLSDIKDSLRKQQRKIIEGYLSGVGGLATDDPKVIGMIENNVFILLLGGSRGAYMRGAKNDYSCITLDDKGDRISSPLDRCNGHDIVKFSPEVHGVKCREVFLHESLHDGWFSILPKSSGEDFISTAKRICNAGGDFELGERWAMNLWYGRYAVGKAQVPHKEYGMLIDSFMEKFSSLDGKEKTELRNALGWYLDLRFYFESHTMVEVIGKQKFIEFEAYTMIFQNKMVPEALKGFYLPVMKEEELDAHVFDLGNSHLSSMESIEALMPTLDAFVQHIKSFFNSGYDTPNTPKQD